MGTPQFAVPSLDIIYKSGYTISAVVTVPDKKKGRGLQFSFSEIKEYALHNNLPILQPENLKDETFRDKINSLKPDLIVVVAFRILPKDIFTIPGFGSINLHASLLPKYRGAAPINRAIINGEKETGVTTFFLKESIDTGNIILQKKISIEENDDAGILHDKLSVLGAEAVLETVRLIEDNKVELITQDEKLVSSAPKIFKEDCIINWESSSENLFNFIRGLSPYPAAYTYLHGKMIKIFKVLRSEFILNAEPGRIIIKDKKLYAGTKDFPVEILELQIEGKKRISAAEYINGLRNAENYSAENSSVKFSNII